MKMMKLFLRVTLAIIILIMVPVFANASTLELKLKENKVYKIGATIPVLVSLNNETNNTCIVQVLTRYDPAILNFQVNSLSKPDYVKEVKAVIVSPGVVKIAISLFDSANKCTPLTRNFNLATVNFSVIREFEKTIIYLDFNPKNNQDIKSSFVVVKSGNTPSYNLTNVISLQINNQPVKLDLNKDGIENIIDFKVFVQNINKTKKECNYGWNTADLNGDCKVDIFDFGIFLQNYSAKL